jgi:alpha-glucan,water dikinase
MARVVGELIDQTYGLLQPKAELLGNALRVEAWTITLFSEEVVRGASLSFILSTLLHHLDPILRRSAKLGNWQIVSPGTGAGIVEVVEALRSVQGRKFDAPRVIIADKVLGDEEIPDGVAAVIAPNVTDIVSHVAVRARNAHLLFASCYDADLLEHLKSLRGQKIKINVDAAGDVTFAAAPVEAVSGPRRALVRWHPVARPHFTRFAIQPEEFNEQGVGRKACNQTAVRSKLPEWVHRGVWPCHLEFSKGCSNSSKTGV